jgi:prepilin-type N-terminal cleavage/methylation domain-containing protein
MGQPFHRAGFTLLEIMVVLVILSMLLGLGVGAFSKVGAGPTMAMDRIREVVRTARFHAMRERAPSAVLVDGDRDRITGLGWKSVGCWHFEDVGEGGHSTGFPEDALLGGVELHGRGVIGRCLDIDTDPGMRAQATIPTAPSLESTNGLALEFYLFLKSHCVCTLVAKGKAFRVGVNEEGRLEGALQLAVPGVETGKAVVLDSGDYTVPLGRWIKVNLQFNGYAFYLAAGGILRNQEIFKERRRLITHDRAAIEIGAAAAVGGGARFRLDELSLAAAVLGEESPFHDSIDIDGGSATIHFDARGYLDRNFHTRPVKLAFIHAGKNRYELTIGQMGEMR